MTQNELPQHGFVLLIVGVPPTIWLHTIAVEKLCVGRSPTCDITVNHRSVSRRHAEVWSDGEQAFIRDLVSGNGTHVAGKRINSATLTGKESVRLGSVPLRVITVEQFRLEWRADKVTSAFHFTGNSSVEATMGMEGTAEVLAGMTEAQLRVLRMMLIGLSESEVALKLGISKSTVHSHVKSLYKTLNVNSRASLMAKFISARFSNV